MRHLLSAAVTCLVLSITSVAAAQDRECFDDSMTDRCTEEHRQQLLEMYGLRSLESHREAGDQVRRAFFVDGFGGDLLVVSFIRSRGVEPRVSVHWPRKDGRRPEPLLAPVLESEWNQVLARSTFFDRDLVPVPPRRDGICLHPWMAIVEATDPPAPGEPAEPIRRRTSSTCPASLAVDYAFGIAARAVHYFPFCEALLDPGGGVVSGLAECGSLRGDRNAAAALKKRSDAFARAHHIGRDSLPRFFADKAIVEWRDGRGTPTVAGWIELMPALGSSLRIDVVHADSPRAGRVEGSVMIPERTEGGFPEGRYLIATVEIRWARDDLFAEFVIERITVDRFTGK
jgi:hypothetical protein